ncbi:hypothetical protein SMICM17S_11536 [Streptomyces microflavus]
MPRSSARWRTARPRNSRYRLGVLPNASRAIGRRRMRRRRRLPPPRRRRSGRSCVGRWSAARSWVGVGLRIDARIGAPTMPPAARWASASACAAPPIWVWTTGVLRLAGAAGAGPVPWDHERPGPRRRPALAPAVLRAGPARRGGRARGVRQEHLAAQRRAALGGAPVLHLDDLATHEELFGWVGQAAEQVLLPLSRRGSHESPSRLDRAALRPARTLDPAPVVLVAGRRGGPAGGAAVAGGALDGAGAVGLLGARQGAGRRGAHGVLGRVDHREETHFAGSLAPLRRTSWYAS